MSIKRLLTFIFLISLTSMAGFAEDGKDAKAAADDFRSLVEAGDVQIDKVKEALTTTYAKPGALQELKKLQPRLIDDALIAGNFETVSLLEQSSFDIDQEDPNAPQGQRTALERAAGRCDTRTVLLLRLFGAKPSPVANSIAKKQVHWFRYEKSPIPMWVRTVKLITGTPRKPQTPERIAHHKKKVENGLKKNEADAQRCLKTIDALNMPIDDLKKADLTDNDKSIYESEAHKLLKSLGLSDEKQKDELEKDDKEREAAQFESWRKMSTETHKNYAPPKYFSNFDPNKPEECATVKENSLLSCRSEIHQVLRAVSVLQRAGKSGAESHITASGSRGI